MWSTDGDFLFTLSDEDYESIVEGDVIVMHGGEGEESDIRLVQVTKVEPRTYESIDEAV